MNQCTTPVHYHGWCEGERSSGPNVGHSIVILIPVELLELDPPAHKTGAKFFVRYTPGLLHLHMSYEEQMTIVTYIPDHYHLQMIRYYRRQSHPPREFSLHASCRHRSLLFLDSWHVFSLPSPHNQPCCQRL